uniref:Neogenin 1 n=1 Tax=Pavo cristatus TaxID=9049 RepID=A0A8C9LA20_PAVCR
CEEVSRAVKTPDFKSKNGSVVRTFTPFYFLVEPMDVLSVRGASVIMNCSAYCETPPKIEWKKDGTLLNLVSDDRRQLLPDGSLLINSVVHSKHNKPDEGYYQCVATVESLGSIVSRTAKLTVAGKDLAFPSSTAMSVWMDTTGRNQTFHLLFFFFLLCSFSDSVSLLPFTKPFADPEEPQSLVFMRQPSSLTKVTGQNAVFPCVAGGFPTPYVRWTKNGEELITEDSERFALRAGGSLLIRDVTEEDVGTYACIAENENETIEAQAELAVQVPPEFLKRPANIYAHESMDIVFECEVTGKPTPTVKWVKNGDVVIPSDYFKIVSFDLDPWGLGLVKSDEGFYQCIAENDVGNAQAGAQLIILDLAPATTGPLPTAPRDVVATLVSTRFIRLTWRTPVSDPQGDNLTYSIFYTKEGINRERVENTSRPGETQVMIQNLMPETVYVFRVVAQNKHGHGESSAPLKVATQPEVQLPGPAPNIRAYAGSPTSVTVTWETPLSGNGEIQNYKLYYMEKGQDSEQVWNGALLGDIQLSRNKQQVCNDAFCLPQSIMLHWQPPPAGTHSGQITGYKIRYRKVSRKSDVTESVGGTQLFQLIEGLERGTEYNFRIAAMTVNGTGPATDWVSAETFESDLDGKMLSVEVSVTPRPGHSRPTHKFCFYTFENCIWWWMAVSSAVTDALFFFQTANATTLSYLVTGLKPNTLYEFSVMVTKGRRSSTWSMTAHGTTFELVPTSPPKDVTVVSKEGKPRTIIVNWQPPSEANGKITGYIIYYSTDVNAEIHDWVIEPVVGNRLTHQIQELTLDTPYYFKIQARNSKGMGPMSEAVQFRTPKASGSAGKGSRPVDVGPDYKPPLSGSNSPHGSPTSPLDSNMLLVIIVSVGVITIVIVVIVAVFCTRRTTSHQKKKRAACKSVNGSHKYKGNSKDVKPPDLWIHHERLELKPIDKSPDPNPIMTDTPIPRNSQDITPVDNSMDSNIHQRRNSYRGHESEDSMSTLAGRRGMRPKMMMPFDSQPPQPVISAHPIHSLDNPHHHFHSGSLASPTRSYLHHQVSPWPMGTSMSHSDRANSTESVRNTPSSDTMPASSSQPCADHQDPDSSSGAYLGSAQEEDAAQSLPTAHVRPSHPLKSFAVPAVPAAGSAYDPALPSTPLLTQQAPSHPVHSVKTASIGTLGRTRPPMPVVVPSAPDVQETTRMLEDSESSYEPDELTKEMAHLEGLMKDLNAITTA